MTWQNQIVLRVIELSADLMVSPSKHELVAQSRHASPFDKLRMKLLPDFLANLFVNPVRCADIR